MKMLSSQTGAIFRKEPAGYVKIFVFMLLGYMPALLLDFRQNQQLRADLLHFIRQDGSVRNGKPRLLQAWPGPQGRWCPAAALCCPCRLR